MAKLICSMAVMLFVLSACVGSGRDMDSGTASGSPTTSSPATAAPVFGGLGGIGGLF
ncbi:hypothetical protein [Azospirillum sp.]|uniref:hypothetical protein n=1 Tax=Azospirillum sp. TaxID=34012 RepID=UPI002D2ED870|nr:hypothetical protein [Azospirillum sp.]HYD69246.1 hypothetical protein [Azospirillum sp.]